MVYEAICAPPADAKVLMSSRSFCPISEHQFQVAAAEQVSIESVLEQVKALLEDRIVVGFAIANDLEVLGISLPPEKVRDLQVHFNAQRCYEPDLSGCGLPILKGQGTVHSLKNLAECVLGHVYTGGSSQCPGRCPGHHETISVGQGEDRAMISSTPSKPAFIKDTTSTKDSTLSLLIWVPHVHNYYVMHLVGL